MFFYLLHLYVLKFLYLIAVALWGLNQGKYFGFDSVGAVWLCSAVLAVVLLTFFFMVYGSADHSRTDEFLGELVQAVEEAPYPVVVGMIST
jgi:low affinity Fe/Cu permease